MNRRFSTCAFAVGVATLALAGVVAATAQVPTPKQAPVTAPALLPSATGQPQEATIPIVPPPNRFALPDQTPPPAPQKPAQQVTPAIQLPAPPQKPEPTRREEQRFGNLWLPGTTTNVRFEAIITDQMGNASPVKKTISVTIADGGRASVRSGVTVPIVSTIVPKEGTTGSQYSSFQYRDMGLNLDIQNVLIDGNYIRASWGVEYNPVDEKVADSPVSSSLVPGPPSFASFKQNLVLALESGKALVVSQSSDPVPTRDRKMTLEVKATILK